MRRVLVAVGSIAALVAAGVLAAGVGARTVEHQPAVSRHARPVLPAGSPCYVSIPRCSQTPCIVFIGSAAAAVSAPAVAAPAAAPSLSAKRCARRQLPKTSIVVDKRRTARTLPGMATSHALAARLPTLAARLPALARQQARRRP
jgi:hypothetical protein